MGAVQHARHRGHGSDIKSVCCAILLIGLIPVGSAGEEEGSVSSPITRAGEIDPGQIQLPPKFFAEKIYSVDRETQGSWVALAIDPQGRMIASVSTSSRAATLSRPGAATARHSVRTPRVGTCRM